MSFACIGVGVAVLAALVGVSKRRLIDMGLSERLALVICSRWRALRTLRFVPEGAEH